MYLMWFDPKAPLAVRVAGGSVAYHKRFGMLPKVVIVHPASYDAAAVLPVGLEVCVSALPQPGIIWLGEEVL